MILIKLTYQTCSFSQYKNLSISKITGQNHTNLEKYHYIFTSIAI